MCTLLSVPVLETGTPSLSLLWTVLSLMYQVSTACVYCGSLLNKLSTHVVPHAGKTALEHYQVGVIIHSVVVLVQTILLVGALVKIMLLTKKSETNISTLLLIHNYIGAIQYRVRAEDKRREVGDGCKCGLWCS